MSDCPEDCNLCRWCKPDVWYDHPDDVAYPEPRSVEMLAVQVADAE